MKGHLKADAHPAASTPVAYLNDDMYNAYSSGANVDMAMNAMSSLIGETEAMAIRSKSLN